MGCGASASQKEFGNVVAHQVDDVVDLGLTDLLGHRVQVVGRTAHTGSVLESPFGQNQGLAMKVSAHYPDGHDITGKKACIFSARTCIDFKLLGSNDLELFVEVKKGHTPRIVSCPTEEFFNVVRDKDEGVLKCGGKKGQMSKLETKPHARQWWDDYNGGKDPVTNMTAVGKSVNGMEAFGNCPRMVKETVLRLGEVAALIGTLTACDAGLKLVVDENSIITNNPATAKAIADCPSTGVLAVQGSPQVLQMRP